jgi:hypothetical protein
VRTVLIPATSDAELKQVMIAVLPGFQHHLDETVRIARKLGYEQRPAEAPRLPAGMSHSELGEPVDVVVLVRQ